MEEVVYHGSSTSGLKIIYPHESTHGNFVYATTDIIVATLFCKRCGDDVTYTLVKGSDGKYCLIEYLPGAFEKMFDNSASIYTVQGETFKDYRTNFNEIMSTSPVRVLAEEFIPNMIDEINRLNDHGDIHLYRYPNVPKGYNVEDHLINQRFERYLKMHDPERFKRGVYRLAGYHPELIDRINKEIKDRGLDIPPLDTNQLLDYYDYQLGAYNHDPSHERYIDSMLYMGMKAYPELTDEIMKLAEKHGYEYHSPIMENTKQV